MDRDMSFEEEAKLRSHLGDCPDCEEELAKVQRMVAMLHGLPTIDPGEGFYARLRDRLAETRAATRPAAATATPSWTERIRAWFGVGLLRPALGGALGLCLGLTLGVGGPRLVAWLGDAPAPEPSYAERIDAGLSEGDELAGGLEETTAGSPFNDLDLTHLAAISDTVRLGSEPELILKRYVTDPQQHVIPMDPDYGRTVSGGTDGQSDVFITF
jgi:hypothetical protein